MKENIDRQLNLWNESHYGRMNGQALLKADKSICNIGAITVKGSLIMKEYYDLSINKERKTWRNPHLDN